MIDTRRSRSRLISRSPTFPMSALDVAGTSDQSAFTSVSSITTCEPSKETLRRSGNRRNVRSEEHTSELQSLMRISYAVFCLKKKKKKKTTTEKQRHRYSTQQWKDK